MMRLAYLSQPMRYDEAFGFLYFASQPVAVGLSDYFLPNNHLFHTWLVHGVYLLMGNQPWVLRLPALIAGILLIPVSYIAARQFYDRDAAILAAGLLAPSSILIEYSTNARGYTLVCLIFMVLVGVSGRLIHTHRTLEWVLFAVISAIGFYTIPIMLYGYGAVVTWLFLSIFLETRNPSRRCSLMLLGLSCFATAVLTIILYTPVFLNVGVDSVIGNRFVAPVSWSEFFERFFPAILQLWRQWMRDIPGVIVTALIVGFFLSLFFHKKLTTSRIPLVGSVFIWLVLALCLRPVVPPSRVWLFLLPLFIVVSSAGLSYAIQFRAKKNGSHSLLSAGISLTLLFWLSANVFLSRSIYYSEETGTLRDAQPIAVFLETDLRPGDKVVAAIPSDAPLAYYFALYSVPLKYLSPNVNAARRLWVVVNNASQQTLQDVVEKKGILMADFSPPKVRKIFEVAVLYEMRRIRK